MRDWTRQLPELALPLAGLALLDLAQSIPSEPLRAVLTLPVIAVLPGYALVRAIDGARRTGDAVPALALMVVLSIAVVPIIVLLLDWLSITINRTSVLLAINAVVISLASVAQVRAGRLPINRTAEESK